MADSEPAYCPCCSTTIPLSEIETHISLCAGAPPSPRVRRSETHDHGSLHSDSPRTEIPRTNIRTESSRTIPAIPTFPNIPMIPTFPTIPRMGSSQSRLRSEQESREDSHRGIQFEGSSRFSDRVPMFPMNGIPLVPYGVRNNFGEPRQYSSGIMLTPDSPGIVLTQGIDERLYGDDLRIEGRNRRGRREDTLQTLMGQLFTLMGNGEEFVQRGTQDARFDQFVTESLIAQGQKDDCHKLTSNFTAPMLVGLGIFESVPSVSAPSKCDSGILMCCGKDIGVYKYKQCTCQGAICETCAEELAKNQIRCYGCVETQTKDHDIILGYKCPTCRKFVHLNPHITDGTK